jgi:hypothetical protein
MMNLLLRRRFQVFVITLIVLFAGYPLVRSVPGNHFVFAVLISCVFVAAFLAVFPTRRQRVAALLMGVPTLIGMWTGFILPGIPLKVHGIAYHLLAAIFMGFCVVTILRTAYIEVGVSADSVYGAFCGYLLIGLAFSHLYSVVETFQPGSFTGIEPFTEQLESREKGRYLLTYFSFITLTTVGYGDISPKTDEAKGLAMVEAIVGQFYIAVLVAELIGKRVAQVLSGPPSDDTN